MRVSSAVLLSLAFVLACGTESREPSQAVTAAATPAPGASETSVTDAGLQRADAAVASAETSETGEPRAPSHAEELATQRTILAGHVENARDLAHIPLAPGKRVAAATLFRGPPLAALSDEACAEVAALQLRTVIDLRVDSEVSLKPDAPCALQGAQLVAAALPIPYNVSATDYIADLDASASIAVVFEVLGDPARYPVYFHCTWGRDRTGILAAVILRALGADDAAIMQDYLVSLDSVGAYPASLEAALAEIEARGGVEAYLAAAGVTTSQLEALRARATESTR
jgi:protein-tyrosine phosphatase